MPALARAPFVSLAFLAALGLPARAKDLEVPSQYPTIQHALDAAAPYDTIHVQGGVYTPVVVKTPVRIVGHGPVTIRNDVSSFAPQPHNVSLAGPGYGTVEIVSLTLAGVTSGFFTAQQGSRIAGTGFSELHLHECVLAEPTWTGLTGIGFGAPAVAVQVPHVLVSRSAVVGGSTGTDLSVGLPAFNGPAGIVNANGTVSVFDSVVVGGKGTSANYPPGFLPPSLPSPTFTGKGGAGVIAREVFHAGSAILGGAGAHLYELFVYKGQQPPGPPIVAPTTVAFPNTLTDAGVPQPGEKWFLTWTGASPVGVLLLTSHPVKPYFVAGLGWSFTDFSDFHLVEAVPSGSLPHTGSLTIPPDPAVVGAEFVAQLWDPQTGLGRPIVRAIVP